MGSRGREAALLRVLVERGRLKAPVLDAAGEVIRTLDPLEARWGLRLGQAVLDGLVSATELEQLERELPAAESPDSLPPAGPAQSLPTPTNAVDAEPAEAELLPSFLTARWARYQFLDVLGQGGMGTVYRARDRSLGRIVALKFIRGDDPALTRRLVQEARAQARIVHPHICRVYEVGEVEARSYIAMEYVGGHGLDSVSLQLALSARVQIVRDVALALHEAHKLGIIHRDLKPANILVEPLGDSQWRPVIMDFGLARELGDSHGLTETGAVMGTPAYMPPEQARGDTRSLDRRSDVYSLGATLYELLCGQPPFDGRPTMDVLLAVLQEEPRPVRSLAPQVPADLETITLKCLSKDPALRYDSARALGEDLQRYIEGEPILGRRPSFLWRVRRQARRNKAMVALGTVATLVVLTLLAVVVVSSLRARQRVLLAQQLGEQSKEVEAIMLRAYMMPLHNIQQERALVVEQLDQVRGQMRVAGGLAAAPGPYALARGYLAMQDYEQAQAHLEQAQRAGLTSAGLHYAQGLILGEFYRRELQRAQFIADPLLQAAALRENEARNLLPAQRHLEAYVQTAPSSQIAETYLAQALLAYFRRQLDESEKLAGAAVSRAPWLYEGRRLQGDIFVARGRQDIAKGNFDSARAALLIAEQYIQQGLAIGRSDPRLHALLAAQQLEFFGVNALGLRHPSDALLARLREVCEQARKASPDDANIDLIWIQGQIWHLQYLDAQGEIPQTAFEQAIADARESLVRFPTELNIKTALGTMFSLKAFSDVRRGGDPRASFRQAAAYLQSAAAISPKDELFASPHSELALLYGRRVYYEMNHGADPIAELELLVQFVSAQVQKRPDDLSLQKFLVNALLSQGTNDYSHGRPIEAVLLRALRAADELIRRDPRNEEAYILRIQLWLLSADYNAALGADPEPPLRRAADDLAAAEKQNHIIWAGGASASKVYRALAQLRAARGEDPSAELSRARAALSASRREEQGHSEYHCEKAELALSAAGWEGRRGRPSAMLLAEAETASDQAVVLNPSSAAVCRTAAQVQLARAEAEQAPQSVAQRVARGLSWLDRARAINPADAEAQLIESRLYLRAAQVAPGLAEKRAAARSARGALERAILNNRLLARKAAPLLQEAAARLTP